MNTTATAWPWATDMPEAAAAPPAKERSILSKFGSGRTPDGTHLIRAFSLSRLEVAQLAAMEFPNPDLPFRRVSIDPVRGAAVMMAPSRLHERIAVRLDKVAEGLGGGVQGGGLRVEQLRGTRWRDREGPRCAGAEADCAFYIGETAEACIRLGDEQVDAFTERQPPDLIVEINVSHTDEGESAWYRRLCVTELWAVSAGKSPDWLEVEFLDLQAPGGSRCKPGIQSHPRSAACRCQRRAANAPRHINTGDRGFAPHCERICAEIGATNGKGYSELSGERAIRYASAQPCPHIGPRWLYANACFDSYAVRVCRWPRQR